MTEDLLRQGRPRHGSGSARERLLEGAPVRERTLDLAGILTPVLEGGDGPPLVLLHGPGEHAPKWAPVLPSLVTDHLVVAPDLPGHGGSRVSGELDAERVMAWLDALIAQTCPTPPVLVGQTLGGAIAARFAADHGSRLAGLVLSDTLGLVPFAPAPEFARALNEFLGQPNAATFAGLWERCAFDLGRLRRRLGEWWDHYEAYTLERIAGGEVLGAMHALLETFGSAPIPPEVLERIAVPTRLIWGREDLVTPLAVAEAASARYGWPLEVIERAADDLGMEKPEEFAEILRRGA